MARAEINIFLPNTEDVAKVLQLLNNIEDMAIERLKLDKKNVFFDVAEIFEKNNMIDFSVCSDKQGNCEWQVERIIVELKELANKEKVQIDMFDGSIEGTDICWCFEDYQFTEGDEEEFFPTLEPK